MDKDFRLNDLTLDSDVTLGEIQERLDELYDFAVKNNFYLPKVASDPSKINLSYYNLLSALISLEDTYYLSKLSPKIVNNMSDKNFISKLLESPKSITIISLLSLLIPLLLQLHTCNIENIDMNQKQVYYQEKAEMQKQEQANDKKIIELLTKIDAKLSEYDHINH